MRYIGIDYGSKKVGVALSDEAGTMGFPHRVLLNTSELVNELAKIANEKQVSAVVIGESRNFSGEENPIASDARAFAEELTERTGIPVHFEPETYTTQEARRFPDGTRMPGSPDVDAAAAALILSSFLERYNQKP
jgi:putative Holliday junction resolvase